MVRGHGDSTGRRRRVEPSTGQVNRFLARQPILNGRREILGYEILSRSGWENSFRGEQESSTQKMIDNCLYLGIEAIAKDRLAFVNCTREALTERLVTILPAKTTVLEVLESVEPDGELMKACLDLRAMGYALALDDFQPRPEVQPLVDIATYIKVDFQQSDAAVRRQISRMTCTSGAALLAEKVEDQAEFDTALQEGYEFFQGYFFCRPKVVMSREIPPNRLNYLRLLAELTREPLDLHRVTQTVELEPSLCYRLLRLANSPVWGVRTQVTSVRDAFLLVGENRFRVLASVAASCVLSQEQPPALISLSLERARFCELLAPLTGQNPTEQFMLGLLSLLDAVLAVPMETIAASLPLREEAKAALLGAKNPAALPLCLIRGFEAGEWSTCEREANEHALSEETLAGLYVKAIQFAGESLASSR
jgi:c-di-GMP phosphodiesterase